VGADEAQVWAVLKDFLQRVDKGDRELADATPLFGDGLELDSLEAAELSVLLEDELGSDPFSSSERLPETVGDILAFYGASSVA
jgi:acyl carrier protein